MAGGGAAAGDGQCSTCGRFCAAATTAQANWTVPGGRHLRLPAACLIACPAARLPASRDFSPLPIHQFRRQPLPKTPIRAECSSSLITKRHMHGQAGINENSSQCTFPCKRHRSSCSPSLFLNDAPLAKARTGGALIFRCPPIFAVLLPSPTGPTSSCSSSLNTYPLWVSTLSGGH